LVGEEEAAVAVVALGALAHEQVEPALLGGGQAGFAGEVAVVARVR
jgi:hypothetical protein